jgi:hypothetical protein
VPLLRHGSCRLFSAMQRIKALQLPAKAERLHGADDGSPRLHDVNDAQFGARGACKCRACTGQREAELACSLSPSDHRSRPEDADEYYVGD